MLTPAKFWRVPCDLTPNANLPPSTFTLPPSIAAQEAPPIRGHGIAVAAYDETEHIGLLRWLGLVTGGTGPTRTVEWAPTSSQIWVDSNKGRSFWLSGAFGFAPQKISDYGLHELWQQHFDGLELRNCTTMSRRPSGHRPPRSGILPERLNPLEVIGEPTSGPTAGVVYVLKSAYGFKVGRTGNIPSRMRAFGVQLPFIYSILMCVWFDDCHAAERRYHDMFANKRINGEWFDLDNSDIEKIRMKH